MASAPTDGDGGMRSLKGAIPRAFTSHKTPEGAAYGRYVRSMEARLGKLPDYARPTLKAAGLVVVDLDRLVAELDSARARGRRRDQNRIRRQMVILRTQLLTLERRLEEIAANQPADLTQLIRGRQ